MRPVAGVGVALITEQFDLCGLERLCLGNVGVIAQLGVKIGYERGRRFVIDELKGSECASRACLNRYAGKAERRTVVAGGRLARA